MANFSILYNGRLCNQLYILYHIYNTYDNVEKIYAPHFKECNYFNIDKLCDSKYYENNKSSFIDIGWTSELSKPSNFQDPKFNDLKLKQEYLDKVNNILKDFEGYDLISVHVRQTDYKNFYKGRFYFTYEKYMEECYKKIKDWGLDKYKILVFSDEKQTVDENSIFISELTDFNGPLDLFIMSHCNYFIHTYTTYSSLAVDNSKGFGIYKDNFLVEREKIPVVFIHYGYHEYIEYTIQTALKYNNKVIFLGDEENEKYLKKYPIDFYYFKDFMSDKIISLMGNILNDLLSTKEGREYLTTDYYRIFCIQKWLILSNFLKDKNIEELFVFDTDNLILDNLNKYDYSEYDFVRYNEIGFQSYIKSSIVHDLSDFILSKEKIELLKHDNIMGLTIYFILSGNYKFLTGDVEDVNGQIFDNAISVNSKNLYDVINDKDEIAKISFNERDIKVIYYTDNDNFYFKRIIKYSKERHSYSIDSTDKYYRLLNLNMSWVKMDYFRAIYNFINKNDNTAIKQYENIVKIKKLI